MVILWCMKKLVIDRCIFCFLYLYFFYFLCWYIQVFQWNIYIYIYIDVLLGIDIELMMVCHSVTGSSRWMMMMSACTILDTLSRWRSYYILPCHLSRRHFAFKVDLQDILVKTLYRAKPKTCCLGLL